MPDLTPRSAFAGLLQGRGPAPAGVWVEAADDYALATVLARRGQAGAVSERVRRLYGLDLPGRPACAANGDAAFVGTGPGAWLGMMRGGGPGWSLGLAEALEGAAAVVDQSGAQGVLRLGGPRVLDLLAKGIFLDLHPSAFPPGCAAATSLAHAAVTVWRPGEDAFALAVPRSYAPAVANWLTVSAAEYGLNLRD